MQTYEINGKEFEIMGYVRLKDKDGKPTEEYIPIVDVPQISDYKYQLMSLKSRIMHPEYYEVSENVSVVMEKLKIWLLARTTTYLYLKFNKDFKACYDFLYAKEAVAV